jgi:hypothetical protein
MCLETTACTSLLHLEQLHSEDIWHKVFLHSDKLTKQSVRVRGQYLIRLSGWSIFVLLVLGVVVLTEEAVGARAVC